MSVVSNACLHDIRYSEGMFLSVGRNNGLPDFGRLVKVLIVMNKAAFLLELYSAWYHEHFRCLKLSRHTTYELKVVDQEELNDYHPFSPYTGEKLMISPKTFLLY